MITRRSLLISTIATTALAQKAFAGGRVGGSPPVTHRGCWATKFDGNTYGQSNGPIDNCPDTSPYAVIFGHFTGSAVGPLLTQTYAPNAQPALAVSFLSSGGRHPQFSMQVYTGANPGGPGNIGPSLISAPGSLPGDIGWHSFAIGIDGTQTYDSGNQIVIMIDRVRLANYSPSFGNPPLSIPFNTTPSGLPLTWQIGGASSSSGPVTKLRGSIAEVKAFFGTQIDVTDPNVLDSFFTSNGEPLPRGDRYESGYNSYLDLTPQLYFTGGQSRIPFAQIGPAQTITNGVAIWDPNNANVFHAVSGAYQTASLDPWGFAGV